jgi:hypothetical protein
MFLVLSLLASAYGAFTARLSGGGFFAPILNKKGEIDPNTGKDKGGKSPFNLTWLPEVTFAAMFAVGNYVVFEIWWLALLSLVWSYLWMQTGHGTAYHMGFYPEEALKIDPKTGKRRVQTLSPVIDPLCKAIGAPLGGPVYCWLFMGLKGFLIALPVLPAALMNLVFWPLSYWIGWARFNNVKGEVETISGTLAGAAVVSGCYLLITMLQ